MTTDGSAARESGEDPRAAEPPPLHLIFTVLGDPGPQGSKTRLGHGAMIESSPKVKPWREAVKVAAIDALAERGVPTGYGFPARTPLIVGLIFLLPRPGIHFRSGKHADLLRAAAPPRPAGRPDLDKLIRSTLDALTQAGVYADDAQVVHLVAQKRYISEADPFPGCIVNVRKWGRS